MLITNAVRRLALLLAVFFISTAMAQTTGTLTGTVTDASGAVIPNAKVTVRNVATGELRNLSTNNSGLYAAYSLPIGRYDVAVSASGFKKTTRTAIQLNVADQLAINFSLEVGNVADTVEVVGSTPTVDTEKADVSYVVGTRQMTDLAVNGRTFTLLQQLLPGASRDTGDEGGTGFGSSKGFAINGQRQQATGFMIDGVENTDMGNQAGLLTSPGMETIGEFKMQTANYSAEYGTAGGANMLVVTRSGTKDFHGAAYEFFRNDQLDARYFFANSQPTLRYNNFGYRIGGPVFIPRLYNTDRSRTFFFFAEEWRKKSTQSTFRTSTPTAAMRAGDFSAEAARIGKPIIDPDTGIPFPNNQIPANRLNPNALLLLQNNFPLPNYGGGDFVNYLANGANGDDWRQETLNVTHQLTNNTQVSVRYIQDTEVQPQAGVLWAGQAFPNIGSTVYLPGHSFLAKATTVISSTLLNEVSYNYASNYGSQDRGSVTLNGAYLAPAGLSIQRLFPLGDGRPDKVPNLSFSGGWGGVDSSYYPWWAHHNIQSVTDNFSWSHGKHSFKFGGTYQYSVTPVEAQVSDQGSYSFSGVFSNDPIADFLLGKGSSYSQLNNRVTPYYDYHQLELYAQDTWKVLPRLTLNLGVRYFYVPHTYEAKDLLYNFLPAKYDPSQAVLVLPDGTIQPGSGNLLNGMVGVKDGLPRNLVNNYPWTFGPRFGFAYDPTGSGRWAIRGGYGIGYYSPEGNDSYGMVGNPPGATNVTVFNPSLDNPATGAAGALQPASVSSLDMNYPIPTVQTYSIDVQRELTHGTLLTAGYVGTRGTHLNRAINRNQPLPVDGYDFDPRLNTNSIPAALISPYQGYAGINELQDTASSSYNSLQVSFKREMSKGLLFEVAYTFSRTITDASGFAQGPQNSYDLRAERGLASFDRAHMLILNYVYDLPFFRNRGGFIGQTLGGWELSGVTQFQTGTPLTIGLTGGNLGLATRPDVVAGQKGDGPQTISQWFNTAAFAYPAYGYFGNAGNNIVRGPGVQQWDLSLFKTFRIGEHVNFNLRGEAFNAFNHTNFLGVSTALGNGDFGQVVSAHEARVMQVSAKIEF
jgi:hypothetical protein